jgi:hypothetical protein
MTRLTGLKDKVYRTNHKTEEEWKETHEEKFWKFIIKNFFGWIPTHLNSTESVCVYRDTFSAPLATQVSWFYWFLLSDTQLALGILLLGNDNESCSCVRESASESCNEVYHDTHCMWYLKRLVEQMCFTICRQLKQLTIRGLSKIEIILFHGNIPCSNTTKFFKQRYIEKGLGNLTIILAESTFVHSYLQSNFNSMAQDVIMQTIEPFPALLIS